MQFMLSDLASAIENHDRAIAGSGVEIWIGSEPTFTLRSSEEPQWLSQALGGDKQAYAEQMAHALFKRHPGSVLLRSVGRQYNKEKRPRWCYGLFERRDKVPVWHGPPDPLVYKQKKVTAGSLESFRYALEQAFCQRQWHCKNLSALNSDAENRLLVRLDANDLDAISENDPRLARSSIHRLKIPETGLLDALAEEGYYLFLITRTMISPDVASLCVELPAFKKLDDFLQCLSLLSDAALQEELQQLVVQGFPPPVDSTVSWTTITPDPAVIEINQAPQPDISHFHEANKTLFAIADDLGLSPYRLHYNGNISDSGGGGQFTLGGRSAGGSPFFVAPSLLPRLVRYINLHPSLSYLFATNYVGSASQSPRPDENTRDSFHELVITLEQLERQAEISPELLHASLAPFLADASGNSHRSELNIEKLWNPFLPLRGCLGLLEFRAFRMPYSPQRSVSLSILLRSIAAMLVNNDVVDYLHDWGDELHDRFALPFFLYQDLKYVLDDLQRTGFGLDPMIQKELLSDPDRPCWTTSFGGCQLTIRPAIEFWPLVGDVASQEGGGSRLVDSSTQRMQISLQAQENGDLPLAGWQLQITRFKIPLHEVKDENGVLRLAGLRYRDFIPWRGLHPAIQSSSPITLYLFHAQMDDALEIMLHNWRVDNTPYDGLPSHLDDAAQRRAERLVVTCIQRQDIPPAMSVPSNAVNGFTLDLRRL
jgi:uncharacterized protein (DUF2126 family)